MADAGADALRAKWRMLAEKAAGDFKKLRARTLEGLVIEPLYPRPSEPHAQPWRENAAWSVSQRVDHPDCEAANRLALADLEGGADALTLVLAESPFARGFGLPVDADLEIVLDGVELDLIGLRLDAGAATLVAMRRLTDLIARRRLTSAALRLEAGYDPIGNAARTGVVAPDDLAELLDVASRAGLAGGVLLADGRPYHEAGAGPAQELAATLATAVAYLRRLETLGLSPEAARKQIAVLLAADADLFVGLAKFRAIRRLWANVERACGLTAAPLRLHAETAWRMMTRFDPWTDAMRTTAAAFAAGLGGADSVTVLPLTLAEGLPDEAARRLARNTQRVLLDEAHLGAVDDPAAGSGALEALTSDLCETAWTLFQSIERDGGIETEAAARTLHRGIAATAQRRADAVARLVSGIVGTSRFPSLSSEGIGVLDVPERPTSSAAGLPAQRDAEPFEALRDRTEAQAAAGQRPAVFLATLGPPTAFGRRAVNAANFFAVAGLVAEIATVERDAAATIAAFAASGASFACLCGTDEAYREEGCALAATLRQAGARRVLAVQDAPEPSFDTAIDASIHDGCNALQVLADTLEIVI